ncbi:immunity 53 family protein [Cognatiluteimonas lumbrici]|uniref:immunity 53 family protein n=1 Tax=Cognatiluteimonas lumbrici TaxID=2559601 RepID=UPI001128D433
MNELQRLQDWYQSHCDGDWEHSYGVEIDTLDNPGWVVRIDLADTELEGRDFVVLERGDSEADPDWIHCRVESRAFVGTGGVRNLAEILGTFLEWAGR